MNIFVVFCFHEFGCFSVNGDDGWQGSAGQHMYYVPTAQTPRCANPRNYKRQIHSFIIKHYY